MTRTSPIQRFRVLATSAALMAAGAIIHAACSNVTAKSSAAPNQKPEELKEVLAKVDDVTITVGDFQDRINKQGPYVRARYTSLERKKEFLDNLVKFEVLAKEAQRRGLDKDEEVVRTMKQVMIQTLMKSEFENKVKLDDISDAEVKTYYDAHPEQYNQPEEVRVAHILVKDEKTAKKVMADARIKGQDNEAFRKLVAEYSMDMATKERGGDLRYFNQSSKELPPEIIAAAFKLNNLGDVAGPVKTAAGIHVIKLTGRRKAVTRSMEEVKPQIKNQLYREKRQTSMDQFVKDLRAKAKVEVHDDRLARVVIEGAPTGAFGGPGVPPPGPGMFHPGGPGAVQAGAASPGMPPGSPGISMPPPNLPQINPPPPPLPADKNK
jgi:peptidyl-prolyl cis-trans isomerase C